MPLWSLIFKLDASEHDAVPSKWLLSKDECWYPQRSSRANKLAKENASVISEKDWIQLRISIIKKDYDNFERCMMDAVRMNQGKRTLTASENEERGRGHRAKRSLYHSESEGSNDSGLTPIKKRTSPRKTAKSAQVHFPPHPETPPAGTYNDPKTSSQLENTVQPKKTNKEICFPSASQHSLPSTSHQSLPLPITCRIKRKHFCVFKQGPLSIETIGHGLCALSRSLNLLRGAIEDSHLDIVSRLTSNVPAEQPAESASRPTPEVDEDDHSETLEIFPIKTIEEFQSFDSKLREEDQYKKHVSTALMSIAASTSYSRAVTSILRFVLHEEVITNFSWKGQKRWREQRISFANTHFSKMLVDAIKKKWPTQENKKIDQTIASWLAQTQLKVKQTKRSRDGYEEEAV